MPRRTRIEILIDILEAINKHPGQPPTRIALYTNMAYNRLAPILAKLEQRGIIEQANDEQRGYRLTEKGQTLLRELRRLSKVLRDFGLETI